MTYSKIVTEQFTVVEHFLRAICDVVSIPLTPFIMTSIKQNHRGVYMRFGKVERIINPGLSRIPIGGAYYNVFVGSQTHTFNKLNILDSNGTPITVTAILQYHIEDPAAYVIKANRKLEVLEREAQVAIRNECNKYPYDSTENVITIRKGTKELSQQLGEALKAPLLEYGFAVEAVNIVEANYAPEVMQQMLMKQQAKAYIEARKEIVDGAIGVAKDTIAAFPDMSKESQEIIIRNLLTTLTSNNTPQPTIQLH